MNRAFANFTKYTLCLLVAVYALYSCRTTEEVSPTDNPTATNPTATNIGIDVSNRKAVVAAYTKEFGSPVPAIGWVGNLDNCQEGTASKVFVDAQLSRINYFRAMAGIDGSVVFVDSLNRKAQKAALMMAVANTLNHQPPLTWKCYSTEGAQAAGRSNLSGNSDNSPDFITQFMGDYGVNNTAVGHRRWILFPRNKTMGTGNVANTANRAGYNALWVIGDNTFGTTRNKTRTEYIAWPVAGYNPYQLVYPRWSFQYDGADFSQAQVSVKSNGTSANPTIVSRTTNGYGENTLVWEMEAIKQPTTDLVYEVTVQGVSITNQLRSFSYKVIVIDPQK